MSKMFPVKDIFSQLLHAIICLEQLILKIWLLNITFFLKKRQLNTDWYA